MDEGAGALVRMDRVQSPIASTMRSKESALSNLFVSAIFYKNKLRGFREGGLCSSK